MKPYIIYTNTLNAGLNNHSDYTKQKNIIVDVIQNT